MIDLVAAFFGARGQGKSSQAKEYLERNRPARLLIFDPMDEYGAFAARAPSFAELHKRSSEGAFALRYVPKLPASQAALDAWFDAFCSIAWERGNLDMLVDELQLVTRPSWAPPAWRACITLGRHQRIRVLALSPRPALIDKSFFSACTAISTCRLNFDDDIATMANVLRVPRERVGALKQFQFIARDMNTGDVFQSDTVPAGEVRALPAPAGPHRQRRRLGLEQK